MKKTLIPNRFSLLRRQGSSCSWCFGHHKQEAESDVSTAWADTTLPEAETTWLGMKLKRHFLELEQRRRSGDAGGAAEQTDFQQNGRCRVEEWRRQWFWWNRSPWVNQDGDFEAAEPCRRWIQADILVALFTDP